LVFNYKYKIGEEKKRKNHKKKIKGQKKKIRKYGYEKYIIDHPLRKSYRRKLFIANVLVFL